METKGARRLRKLTWLCNEHGGAETVAAESGVSEEYLGQILKGVLLPAKADGSRSARILGDAAARKIEAAYRLGNGWFDSDEGRPALPDDLQELADAIADFDKPTERAAAVLSALTAIDLYRGRLAQREKRAPVPRKARGQAR